MAQENPHFYFKELMSDQCQCERPKHPKFSFCYSCYKSLPKNMQRALYSRIGSGYEEAYEQACEYLND